MRIQEVLGLDTNQTSRKGASNLTNWFVMSMKCFSVQRGPLDIVRHSAPTMQTNRDTSLTTSLLTTTTTTTVTGAITKSYNKVDCGSNGFYQVGSGCYTFTFYRSVTYKEAEEFCKVSGGELAVLDSRAEMDWIRHHLTEHVVANIYPHETVTFFVGGRVDTEWVWSDGSEVDEGYERCLDDYHVGECLAIIWNEERGCRFSLTDINCKLRDRFICERRPQ